MDGSDEAETGAETEEMVGVVWYGTGTSSDATGKASSARLAA